MQPIPIEQLPLLELVEEWRPVSEAPVYEVSTHGRVRRGEWAVASWPNAKGYHLVSLEIAGVPRLRYVHRLLLAAFKGPAAGRIANHESGRKGENTLENLEWTTHAGNTAHAWATGLIRRDRRRRETCRYGHQLDQLYRQGGRTWRRCSRCRKAAYRREIAEKNGLRSLLALLD